MEEREILDEEDELVNEIREWEKEVRSYLKKLKETNPNFESLVLRVWKTKANF